MNEVDFCREWMAGYDWRFAIYDPETKNLSQQFILHKYPEYYAELIKSSVPGVYLTVNPMRDLDHTDLILKIGYDFDGKDGCRKAFEDAQLLRKTLRERWGCESLLIFTGGRGYHLYFWLKVPYTNPDAKRIVDVYRELYRMSTYGLTLETIDTSLDYPKHQMRAPFTLHQKTGDFCRPVEVVNELPEVHPIEPGFTDYYRSHGVPSEVVHRAEMNLDKPKPQTPPVKKSKYPKKLRPCLDGILRTGTMDDDGWLRAQAVFELRRLGVKEAEVKALFKNMPKYDEEKTDYHVHWVYQCKGDKRVKCGTIAGKGYCMGEGCLLYRWLAARGSAPQLNPTYSFWEKQAEGTVT